MRDSDTKSGNVSEEERAIYPTTMIGGLQMVTTPSYSEEEEAASTTERNP